MIFKELRNNLTREKFTPIKWTNSRIVEFARILPNGAIEIHNGITGKTYIWPRKFKEIHVEIYKDNKIKLGDMIPKSMR
jgi:hypothetical protein